MARGTVDPGRGSAKWWCSYKRITIIVCCVNLIAALFVLRWFYAIAASSGSSGRWISEDQIRRIQESIRVRRALEPFELVKAVRKLKKEWSKEQKRRSMLPQTVKHKVAEELLERFINLQSDANATVRGDMLELWRTNKLKEVEEAIESKSTFNSSIPYEEQKMLKQALKYDWTMLLEDIGLWMPSEVVNTEHDDKPEDAIEQEEEIIPGRPLPPECHAEPHTDYDGAAVRWGITHHKESAADCCQACLDQAKYAKPEEMKCNIWVYCPLEFGCFSPDIYEHKHQECWLKQAEKPRLNFKDKYSESYRSNHPTAPLLVPWISGIVSA